MYSIKLVFKEKSTRVGASANTGVHVGVKRTTTRPRTNKLKINTSLFGRKTRLAIITRRDFGTKNKT